MSDSQVSDSQVSALLRVMNDGFPRVHEMTGAQARAAVAARRQPVGNLDDVRSAEDRSIGTEHGRLGVRIYYPYEHGSTPLPVVVFCHGGGFVFCDLDSHDGFCRRMAKNASAVGGFGRLPPRARAPCAGRGPGCIRGTGLGGGECRRAGRGHRPNRDGR